MTPHAETVLRPDRAFFISQHRFWYQNGVLFIDDVVWPEEDSGPIYALFDAYIRMYDAAIGLGT